MITVPARQIGPDCGCLQKCMIKLNAIDIVIILTLFKNYWALENYDLQTSYLIKQSVEKESENKKKREMIILREVKNLQSIL